MGLMELKPIANSRVRRRVIEVVGDRGTRDEDLGTVMKHLEVDLL